MTAPSVIRFPYQDPAAQPEHRVEDLLARMDLFDKVGVLFHSNATVGMIDDPDEEMGLPPLRAMIVDRRMNHFVVAGAAPSGREFGQWHNEVQRIAAASGLGIPITFSSDPRHGFAFNPATSYPSGQFSQWPEPLGIAAIGDEELAEQYGAAVREEYAAVGIRVALHPQLDLATEPRWARAIGTFGEDAELASRMGLAYLRGLQAGEAGESVAGMIKHFPGGGPQLGGLDPHFGFGREQVYPGGMFDYHLRPFKAAIAQGVTQLMPSYGMPVGRGQEEVGFAFNKEVMTDLLRGELGYDGVVCADWGVLTDEELFGQFMPARAWGLETRTPGERAALALDAGVDQFGGEADPQVLLDAIRSGLVTEDRVDQSVRRVLHEKFRQGLFEARFVDEDHAAATVGRADLAQAGLSAQHRALTLLTNRIEADRSFLPLRPDLHIYSEGIDTQLLGRYATPVDRVDEADAAIVRVASPRESTGDLFTDFFANGSLAFDEGRATELAALCWRIPTALAIFTERPVVLDGLEAEAAAILADFGSTDQALLDVLFGEAEPAGRLPVEFPRSMAAVEASREDVPFDTDQPTFRFGHGLRYTPPTNIEVL